MSWSWVLIVLVGGFVALNVALQVVARRRAARLRGQPLPALPGATGQRISASGRALVYFFTPTCAACRPLTPRMKALADKGQPVFPVDAMQEPELARAFSVMATPTTVEIQEGRVAGVSIGPVVPAVWARFGEGT
ncbi:MAG: thioredoxin family protein [Myxococcaceae bacterium]|nr:thioredoxin family protein [Myxococcaceae bacterium]